MTVLTIANIDNELEIQKTIFKQKAKYKKLCNSLDELNKSIEDIQFKYAPKYRDLLNRLEALNDEILVIFAQKELDRYSIDFGNLEEKIREEREKAKERKRFFLDQPEDIEPGKDKSKLRGLFRELVKVFHPDLVVCKAEKERREKIMKSINLAYKHGEIDILLGIQNSENFFEYSSGRIEGLKFNLLQIEESIKVKKAQITKLKRSKFYILKTKMEKQKKDCSEAFKEIENTLLNKIKRIEHKLKLLKLGEAN